MKRRAILLVVMLALVPGLVRAQTAVTPPPSQIYRLTDKSLYQDGCFAPCLCPVFVSGAVSGTFRLSLASRDPLFTIYAVTEVNLIVPLQGSEVRITGEGTYKIGGDFALTEELQLVLKVGDRDPAKYDSGLVVGGGEFPAINLTVAMNSLICRDTAITFAAVPVPAAQILPFALAGSDYEEGCFGPCDCAISQTPVGGRFGLVKLSDANGLVTFGVVDARWRIGRPTLTSSTADGVLVNGFGIYQVSSPPATQRMLLDLTFDGRAPQRFDSGVVRGGGNPFRIDIALAANGYACFDQVFDLHAKRIRPPATMSVEPLKKGRRHNDKSGVFSDPQ